MNKLIISLPLLATVLTATAIAIMLSPPLPPSQPLSPAYAQLTGATNGTLQQQAPQSPPTTSPSPLANNTPPTPPPTNDPELQRFNQIYFDCFGMLANFGTENAVPLPLIDSCIATMKQVVDKYCNNYMTYNAEKCAYVTREDVSLFLQANDMYLGLGNTPQQQQQQPSGQQQDPFSSIIPPGQPSSLPPLLP